MIGTLGFRFAVVALALGCQAAPPQAGAEKDLEAAIHKEVVQGDLKGAIERYRKILEQHAKNRAVAARSLYQLGECQEKLGQAEARKAFERVVKEYGDQVEVAARARTKLAGIRPTEAEGQLRVRRIEPPAPGCIVQELEARWMACLKDDGLYLREVRTGQERKLVAQPAGRGILRYGGLSPDEKTLAYLVMPEGEAAQLRAMEIDGSGDRLLSEIKVDNAFPWWTMPLQRGWSKDGKNILAVLTSERANEPDSGSELVVISVADGQRRTLRRLAGVPNVTAVFSPDERFVAFESRANNRALPEIYIAPLAGGESVLAVGKDSNNRLVGWHSDGRLAFVSDRSGGSIDVWAIRINNGRPEGEPELVHSNVMDRWGSSPWLGRGGAIRYEVYRLKTEIHTASLDPASGQLASGATVATKRFRTGNWSPDYSPDGRFLFYATASAPDRVRFIVQDLASGDERVYPAPFRTVVLARWYPDGAALLVHAIRQMGEREALYRFVPATGEVTTVVTNRPIGDNTTGPMFSRDGRYLYFRSSEKEGQVERLELSTGEVKVLFRPSQPASLIKFAASPDGCQIAFGARQAGRDFLGLVPVTGGEPKTLLDFGSERMPGLLGMDWTADGKAILYQRGNQQGGADLWLLSLAGGEPRKLLSTGRIYNLAVHPNGRDIAWGTSESRPPEYWVIENALAPRPASR